MIDDKVMNDYIALMSSEENGVLSNIRRKTYLESLSPRMISGPYQALFLQFLINMIKPSRVLEIGAFTGYSTIAMAQASLPNCIIDTVEFNEELITTLRQSVIEAGYENKILIHHTSGISFLNGVNNKYDFIFIDANKEMNKEYVDLSVSILQTNGIIAVDNTLWSGKVLSSVRDKQTENIHQFNRYLKERRDLEVILLPIRDGLTLIRKIV